jgi:tRNA (guanine-N(7)-)-methyltransferase
MLRAGFEQVHLEVGVSSGKLLLQMARANPEWLFVGIDVRHSAFAETRDRIEKHGLRNVVVAHAEAVGFLDAWSEKIPFDVIHVYHPTPKPSHEVLAERLIRPRFVDLCRRVLRLSGFIRIVTDDESYFRKAMTAFEHPEWWRVDWDYDLAGDRAEGYVPTERRHRMLGSVIYAAQFTRMP